MISSLLATFVGEAAAMCAAATLLVLQGWPVAVL